MSRHALHAAAARNNADWCASVCRSHGITGTFSQTAWHSAERTPPYYPDAVTLHPDAVPGDVLPEIDTVTPGCSIKDSFATLDLTPDGFAELFTAQWIHRPAGLPTPPGPHAEQVTTAAHLRDWQAAWHGDADTPDIFRPELLRDPSVLVLAVHDGKDISGGAVLNRSSGVVGVSNLFGGDIWSSVVAAAAEFFPGTPLVGYEHGDDLEPALASGFTVLGPLRVWVA
ncbi:hypothetical protein ALI144C_16730 [Actinosynnema sp. ALI-1.44]|uniref:hypothetical protein n=1 Tax=Actinosynnema sp. ALI-1.44 TaxID=1933779 RepID=UPI00097C3C2E|nr:hypothetical protein [Actinosynnema sp. ALI-1.44]ONI83149.1 hypothetical protein ALI144C_16730 [Actinosynnema sp. ALI-1.44]